MIDEGFKASLSKLDDSLIIKLVLQDIPKSKALE